MNAPPLPIYCDPTGSFNDDGSRGPLWSSDCRPAPTLKALCGELLMAGWPLSEMLLLPGADEPERFSDIYKREFGGKLPGAGFAKFQRDARVAQHMQDRADPYGTGIAPSKFARSDYGSGDLDGGK